MPSRAKAIDGLSLPSSSPGPTENARTNSIIEIVALAGLSVLGVLALLPSADEKTAALIADKRFPQAISLLESRARQLPLNNFEVFSLARLYRQTGDDAKALPMLEQMLNAEPGSAFVLRELADLYRAQNRPADELGTLLQLFQAAPDGATNDRLVALYRQRGDTAGEQAQRVAAEHAGLGPTTKMPEIVTLPTPHVPRQSA